MPPVIGKFIVQRECCARLDGSRQTFTIHICSPSDPIFVPLPMPFIKDQGPAKKKSHVCSACNLNVSKEGLKKKSFFAPASSSTELWVFFKF